MKPLHFAVGLLATLTSVSLHAQTMDAHANIPFEFRVGDKLMPAGEYSIHSATGWLELRENGRSPATAVTLTYATDLEVDTPVLQFKRFGETYFLETLSNPGFTARAVAKGRLERELARRSSPAQSTVALKTR